MSILVDKETKLCVSGITGREGTFHALRDREYGTNVVGGVTPGKGGQDVEGIPVFDTVAEAVAKTEAAPQPEAAAKPKRAKKSAPAADAEATPAEKKPRRKKAAA